VNITREKTAKSGASRRVSMLSTSASVIRPVATASPRICEVRGVHARAWAAALAHSKVPFHDQFGEAGGFRTPIDPAGPIHLEALRW
jgi:hypothetical protein